MLLKEIFLKTKYILQGKRAALVFYALFLMVTLNFIENVTEFSGLDKLQMYHPMKMLLLSYNKTNYRADLAILLTQLYPFLVCIPGGFIIQQEKQLGVDIYAISRQGKKRYFLVNYLSVFAATSLIFIIPFLIEIVLNVFSFPLGAQRDFGYVYGYNEEYMNAVHNYLFSWAYRISPYFCAVIGTVWFGIVSGLLGTITAAISGMIQVKYKVVLFLPVFLGLQATQIFSHKANSHQVAVWWPHYLMLFDDTKKNVLLYEACILLIILVTTYCLKSCEKRDSL